MDTYGLIIIDDEEMMRDGLSSLIKWEKIGFHLDGVFEDGREAIEWLGENDTHVILTDLRMTHASGLDVASFVRSKKLDIRVVIISGYSDFEAAQKALGYQIRDYLLKPISVKRIRETFGTLKEELDADETQRASIEREIEYFESLKRYAEERFLSQLVLGGFRRPAELEQQLQRLNWSPGVLSKPCAVFTLNTSLGDYDGNDRNNLIGGIISRYVSPPRFYWFRTSEKELGGIFVECGEYEGLADRVRNNLERVGEQARTLSLDISVKSIRIFPDLGSLARSTDPGSPSEETETADAQLDWEERQRMIISHVLENQETLALELLESYMEFLHQDSWDNLINGIVDLFSNINHTFTRMKSGMTRSSLISFADFFSLRSRDAVYEWCRETLLRIIETVQRDAAGNQNSLIHRAMEYVQANATGSVLLSNVAEQVNLSPVYFSRLFKELAGVNFSDYLIKCRIDKACTLLRETEYKIYEICGEAGYTDVKYFYGLFKKHMGCTPSEYRHGR